MSCLCSSHLELEAHGYRGNASARVGTVDAALCTAEALESIVDPKGCHKFGS